MARQINMCTLLSSWIIVNGISQIYCGFSSNVITNLCSSVNSTFPYCTCSTPTNIVDCSNQNRETVPLNFPEETLEIDLSNNAIENIQFGAFYRLFRLRRLDLRNNAIQTIEDGAFDRLFGLIYLILSTNRLQTIDNYYFSNLASLQVIELDNNRIESVKGDAFLTLPAIRQINMTNNNLQCGCETSKLMEWFWTQRSVELEATCVNVGAEDILKVDHSIQFKCAGDTLFPRSQFCRSCKNAASSRECEKTGRELPCPGYSCYTQYSYRKDGFKMWKSCENYERCIKESRNTNPTRCYKSNGDLQCHFCCSGNLCNDENIGNLLQTVNFNVTFILDAEIISEYNDPFSKEFQTFESDTKGQLEKELKKNQSLGTHDIKLLSVSGPNFTAVFSVKSTTAIRTKVENVYDHLYATLKSTSTLELGIENASIIIYEVTNTDICPLQNVTTITGTYQWPSTSVGNLAQSDCHVPMKGKYAKRYCDSVNGRAHWRDIDDTQCYITTTSIRKISSNTPKVTTEPTTPLSATKAVNDEVTASLSKLANKTITNANAENITTELKTLSQKSSRFSPLDLDLTVSKLDELVEFKSNASQPTRDANIARIISNVLETSTKSFLESQQQSNTLTRFLGTIQEFVDEVNLKDGNFSAVNANCALFAFNISEKDYMGLTLKTDLLPGQRLDGSRVTVVEDVLNTSSLHGSTIVIPSTLAQELNDTSSLSRITFVVFRSGDLFSALSDRNSTYDKQKQYVKAPNSLILSAGIPNVEVNNLETPIVLRFVHKQPNAFNPQCSFWDVNNTWSTRGCFVNESVEGGYTVCTCNHLTNFALVMDIYGIGDSISGVHKKLLTIISYIGCGISSIALLLTLVCYLITRKLRSTNPSKLLINLSIALTVTNILFIVGQQSYAFENYVVCKVVGVVMHYFLLSAMTWMAIEAFFIYLALVKVFNIHIRYFLLKSCLIGWGVPLVIVGITVAINGSDNYGLQAGDICWLATNAFYGAFLGPVSLILIWNFCSFVLVTRALWFSVSSQLLKKSVHNEMSARLRRAISIVILFGLTWTFAIFAVNRGGLAFQYLFTVFNSLQGFFIFIFYCLLNKEMKGTWTRIIPCCRFSDDKAISQSSKETNVAKPQEQVPLQSVAE